MTDPAIIDRAALKRLLTVIGGDEEDLAELVAALTRDSHGVVSLSEDQVDLETLFLRVTKGKLQ